MNFKQIVSLTGVAVVLIGCFMPVANNFVDSNVGYMFSRGTAWGGVALVVMMLAAIYGAWRDSSVLVLIATCLGGVAFVTTLLIVSGLLGDTEDFAELSVTAISYRAGTAVIIAGLLIMLGSTLMMSTGNTVQTRVKKRRGSRTSRSNVKHSNIHRTGLTRARNLDRSSTRRSSSGSIFKSGHRSGRKRSSASR